MDKALQTAKLEELKKTYKNYKRMFEQNTGESAEETKAELYWITTILKDLKWVLDDTQY